MDPTDVLWNVLIVLVGAKVAAELAERIGLPAVVGEIAAGVLLGPSVLGWVELSEPLEVFAELGVILLLLEVGLHLDLAELGAVGTASLRVAVVGVCSRLHSGSAPCSLWATTSTRPCSSLLHSLQPASASLHVYLPTLGCSAGWRLGWC